MMGEEMRTVIGAWTSGAAPRRPKTASPSDLRLCRAATVVPVAGEGEVERVASSIFHLIDVLAAVEIGRASCRERVS